MLKESQAVLSKQGETWHTRRHKHSACIAKQDFIITNIDFRITEVWRVVIIIMSKLPH